MHSSTRQRRALLSTSPPHGSCPLHSLLTVVLSLICGLSSCRHVAHRCWLPRAVQGAAARSVVRPASHFVLSKPTARDLLKLWFKPAHINRFAWHSCSCRPASLEVPGAPARASSHPPTCSAYLLPDLRRTTRSALVLLPACSFDTLGAPAPISLRRFCVYHSSRSTCSLRTALR